MQARLGPATWPHDAVTASLDDAVGTTPSAPQRLIMSSAAVAALREYLDGGRKKKFTWPAERISADGLCAIMTGPDVNSFTVDFAAIDKALGRGSQYPVATLVSNRYDYEKKAAESKAKGVCKCSTHLWSIRLIHASYTRHQLIHVYEA